MKKIKRFLKLLLHSSTGTAGLIIVVVICLCAIFAGQLAPHDPNAMDLTNMTKPPVWMEGGDWNNVLGTSSHACCTAHVLVWWWVFWPR